MNPRHRGVRSVVCSARRPELVTTCHSSQDPWPQSLAPTPPPPILREIKISDVDLFTECLLCVRVGGPHLFYPQPL